METPEKVHFNMKCHTHRETTLNKEHNTVTTLMTSHALFERNPTIFLC